MSITASLLSLRASLGLVPVEWVLWVIDARGVFVVHEGPGLQRTGVEGEGTVGRSVWELYEREEPVLDFMRRVLEEPASALLEFNGYQFRMSGGPVVEGGAMGLALAVGPVRTDEAPREEAPRRSVIEVTQPLPELGAAEGDLLIVSADDPDRIGLYRSVRTRDLPFAARRELEVLTPAAGAPDPSVGPAAPAGSSRSPRERAPHLRLLP